jgi:Mg2+-importing ATPase
LLASTVVLALVAPLIPYLPFAAKLGFVPMPSTLLLAVVFITGGYVLAAEAAKRVFYRR